MLELRDVTDGLVGIWGRRVFDSDFDEELSFWKWGLEVVEVALSRSSCTKYGPQRRANRCEFTGTRSPPIATRSMSVSSRELITI